MDIERIERRLRKINTVLEVFKEDNKLTHIERDLLLGYVRELYDIIKESQIDEVESSKEILSLPKIIPVEEVKKEVYKPIDLVQEPSPIVEEKVVIPPVVKPMVTVEEIKEEKTTIKESQQVTEIPTIKEEVKVEPIKEVEVPKHHVHSTTISDDLHSIFESEEITDPSERFSMTKIDDIAKVIGINERIFTINELFDGNGKLFEETIKKLNAATSFEDAKHIIIHEVAIPLKWEEDDNLRKAQKFIKHVRRRFI